MFWPSVRGGWRRATLAHSCPRRARRERGQPRRTEVRWVRDRAWRAAALGYRVARL